MGLGVAKCEITKSFVKKYKNVAIKIHFFKYENYETNFFCLFQLALGVVVNKH